VLPRSREGGGPRSAAPARATPLVEVQGLAGRDDQLVDANRTAGTRERPVAQLDQLEIAEVLADGEEDRRGLGRGADPFDRVERRKSFSSPSITSWKIRSGRSIPFSRCSSRSSSPRNVTVPRGRSSIAPPTVL
jgi:hypothetical protein